MNRSLLWLLSILLFLVTDCTSQDSKTLKDETIAISKLVNRQPAVAGQFYPASAAELQTTLQKLFIEAEPKSSDNVLAVIVPHAGYLCYGGVAATTYNQIDDNKTYDNIFIIASSHYEYYDGASIYNIGNYDTPLGEVKVNLSLANKLIDENDFFSYVPAAHRREHSIEVHLPFLQYILKKDFRIVPILLGAQTEEMCGKIASVLKPYFNSKNLFIISSDFSHYPDYDDAVIVDEITASAIETNSIDKVRSVLSDNSNLKNTNLSTSM